jgi:hypothetical protein
MASRLLNRRELRKQSDEAEALAAHSPEAVGGDVPAKKGARKKTAAAPKVRKPRKAKAPPRLQARWGLFDASMKQVAVFDYNQRAAADQKLADLLISKKGMHFLQLVKEPMAEPALAEAVAVE